MKYRICRCYNPIVGTWYVVQKRILFWWRTLPFAFDKLSMANQFIDVKNNKEEICITPLSYNDLSFEFEERYGYDKTNVIKVRT